VIGLFLRAYCHVLLVAANVTFVATTNYWPAFLTGFGISAVWWLNSRSASRMDGHLAHLVYATGAACGTVSGMALAGLLSDFLTG